LCRSFLRVRSGVSASSIVDLKAELYEKEQQAKRHRNDPSAPPPTVRRGKLGSVEQVFARGNKGVEARAKRDLANSDTPVNQLAESKRKLAEKAEQYERLQQQQTESTAYNDLNAPLVDFQMKQWQASVYEGVNIDSELQSSDTRGEAARRQWEEQTLREEQAHIERRKRQDTLNTVIEEENDARASVRALQAKRKRQQAERLAIVRMKTRKRLQATKPSTETSTTTPSESQTESITTATTTSTHHILPSDEPVVAAKIAANLQSDSTPSSKSESSSASSPPPPPPPPPPTTTATTNQRRQDAADEDSSNVKPDPPTQSTDKQPIIQSMNKWAPPSSF